MRNASLEGADLSNANLAGTCVQGANLKGATLAGACLERAIFQGKSSRDMKTTDTFLKYFFRYTKYKFRVLLFAAGTILALYLYYIYDIESKFLIQDQRNQETPQNKYKQSN